MGAEREIAWLYCLAGSQRHSVQQQNPLERALQMESIAALTMVIAIESLVDFFFSSFFHFVVFLHTYHVCASIHFAFSPKDKSQNGVRWISWLELWSFRVSYCLIKECNLSGLLRNSFVVLVLGLSL